MIWSQESLRAMPESELCQKVLAPLFEAMGYQDINYYHGGTLEQGKDFVMWRDEPPKGRINYAVAVKAKKITGAASGVMHEVLMQVKQSLGSRYVDKRTSEEQPIHECYIVSSHEIKKEGANSLRSLLFHEKLIGRVFTIDGDDLWKLVQQHLPQHTIHARLNDAYKALGSPHPDYEFAVSIRGKERRFDLVPKHPDAEPIPVSSSPKFPETPEGQRKRKEFKKFVEDGASVELTHEHIPFEELPEALRILFPFAEGQPYKVIMGPSQLEQPLPMSLAVEGDNGSTFTLPTIEFTERHGGIESTTLSNLGQSIPLKVFLKASDKDGRIRFNYTFQFVDQSVYWLVQAVRLQKLLSSGARFVVRDLITGVVLTSFRTSPGQINDWGEEFLQIALDVLEIQDAVRIPILVPGRPYFTDRDVTQVALIRKIIDTGKLPYGASGVKVTCMNDPGAAKALLENFEKAPGPDFRVGYKEHFEKLLGQNVSLGPMDTLVPAARLSPKDLEKLRRCAVGKSRLKEINLRVTPGEGRSIEVTFPRWPKSKDADPLSRLKEGSRPRRKRERKPRPQ